ncbi:hypothetical protein ACFQAT_18615 [Undibacterium arcticum]
MMLFELGALPLHERCMTHRQSALFHHFDKVAKRALVLQKTSERTE